ncbi:short-subunit dehydrogenase [Thioalkalivibrio sp. ALE21]|uniref:SDR family oxidoreductase n=1 Tax=Thioalkalivibrio sp. ALE21 TaxID=1158175 RepID=UPI000D860F72|nr:SDR family oxidoreductase [Thioalkalivibrio sp. ALE21]PYG01286.1 short-subunit dehydrogenase [Thioalkalivibrio sp. ALE21]
MNPLNNVVIFGATSAIASAVARRLASSGARLFCVARNPERLESLLADLRVRGDDAAGERIRGLAADPADPATHADAWTAAREHLGEVDAALLAWGSLPDPATCHDSVEATQEALRINGTSAVALLTRIAPDFEAQGHGVIGAIGSVAGDRGRQSNYVYGTAKGMLATYLQGLRHRLAPAGVDVVTLKPGFVTTPMTEGFDRSGPLWASPDSVARGILRALRRGRAVAYLPWFWRVIMTIIRAIPDPLFRHLRL